MFKFFLFSILGIFVSQHFENINCLIRTEVFQNGSYTVSWEADHENEIIYFNVSVATTGFVGFGIAPDPRMENADIVVAGVDAVGVPYFADYHGIGEVTPVLDESQDWTLIDASESEGRTNLRFSRPFETCDAPYDVAITEDTLNIIWSYGLTDVLKYHGDVNRGAVASNILDPPPPPLDTSGVSTWNFTRIMEMPAVDTTYWCTIHRQEHFESDQYVVGFAMDLPTQASLTHTHHIVLYKCIAPDGQDPEDYFQRFVDHPGDDCYYPIDPTWPIWDCKTITYIWAIGGGIMTFPDEAAYPIGDGSTPTYWMYEIHYNNEFSTAGIEVETTLQILHQSEAREYEAELLAVLHNFMPTHLIPPMAQNFVTVGHCSPDCTTEFFPPEGVNVFNVLMHSHLAVYETRVRHFRDGVELPWLANDFNFDFDYQQNRPLRNFTKLLPGDQLAYECYSDTTRTDPPRSNVTLAGLGTLDEMCEATIWYYPKTPLNACGSFYANMPKFWNYFGVSNVTFEYDMYNPTVTAPPEHAGKLFSQVASEFPWTDATRAEMQDELRFSRHAILCSEPVQDGAQLVGYPEFEEPYERPTTCNATSILMPPRKKLHMHHHHMHMKK